jgi:hypothetical protein
VELLEVDAAPAHLEHQRHGTTPYVIAGAAMSSTRASPSFAKVIVAFAVHAISEAVHRSPIVGACCTFAPICDL